MFVICTYVRMYVCMYVGLFVWAGAMYVYMYVRMFNDPLADRLINIRKTLYTYLTISLIGNDN